MTNTSYANAQNYANNSGAKIQIRSAMQADMSVEFLAFVSSFNDSFTSQWNTETVYGRQDPIGTFQATTRVITLGFDIVAFSREDAKNNMKNVNTLTNMLYPSYKPIVGQISSGALSLSKAPLVEMKFANLIQEDANDGFLLGWISSFSANPAIDMGMFTEGGESEKKLFPKVYNASLTFNPQHREQLGFTPPNKTGRANFPYDGGE